MPTYEIMVAFSVTAESPEEAKSRVEESISTELGDDTFDYLITGEPSDKEFTAPEEQSRRFFVYRLGAGGRFYYRTEENPQQAFLHFRIAMGHHEASIHDLYVRLPNRYELINGVNTLIQGEYVPIDSASIATGGLLR